MPIEIFILIAVFYILFEHFKSIYYCKEYK